jgi:hypothetical protein
VRHHWRSAGLALAIAFALTAFAVAQNNDQDDQPVGNNGYYGMDNGYVNPYAYPSQNGYGYQNEQQYASQMGYQDGFAKGQQDRAQNKPFKYGGENWEDATHGYNKQMGPKDQYKQLYRQGFMQGYNTGYGANGANGPYGPPVNGPYSYNGPYNGPYGPVYQNGPYPYPYNGTPVYQGNMPSDPAFQYGYRDGVTYGQGDARNGRSFNDHRGDAYKRADDGYNKSYGEKDDYQNRYRQGYTQGYRAGWSQVTGAMPPR